MIVSFVLKAYFAQLVSPGCSSLRKKPRYWTEGEPCSYDEAQK